MAPSLPSGEEPNARLERLLERYATLLRRQIAQHCPRDLGIQIGDIEQDARLRLWKALEREKELRDPASYIYRIAVTTTIDAVRRVLARREEQLQPREERQQLDDDNGEATIDFVANPVEAPDAVTERRELMSIIAAAVGALADNRRQAVELHLQGLSLSEIAELLRWSEPKARNLVYRGLEDLREALRAEGIEYP
jgi:RNA polymerase sigma-70 factor (ECF subfamily)